MSPPTFLNILEPDLVQKVGTTLLLKVEVEPDTNGGKVFFEWRGPSTTLDASRVSITEEGFTTSATITPLSLQDQGVWVCSAKNKHGISQTKCNIIAQVPKSYKPPVFLEELSTSVTDTGTVSLECKVVGIPSPILRWFKDGDEIKSGDMIAHLARLDKLLLIHMSMKRGDMFALQANLEKPVSVYKCEAINCMGSAASSSVLDITKSLTERSGPPVFSEGLMDRKVKIGEVVELTAALTTLSLPVKISWYNHGSKIQYGDKYNLVEKGSGRYSVIINPVELSDDGEWKIVAENKFGTSTSQCVLTLRVPKNYRVPKFVEDLKAVLTKEGLVSFECKVVGFPTPVLRWFKDGAELKPGDVYQLSGSKSLGTYSCLARNCMGEAVSTASLTVEDIGEKFPDSAGAQLRFLVPLRDAQVEIGENQRLSVQVTYSPCLELAWFHGEAKVIPGDRIQLCKEDGGYFHCDLINATIEDQGEWSVVAKDSANKIKSSCIMTVAVPKHYKKPNFLEPLKAVLTDEGAVNLECKVIGVPQPTLSWYKDGSQLKAGDIHRLMSGSDGSCCLGTYTCVASNCMGQVTSSAALLGYDDAESPGVPDIKSPDLSGDTVKPFSLSTIQEERTSQLMSPEAHEQVLSRHSSPSLSFGKVDEVGDMSISIGNQEVTLSLYQTPDLSEKDAKNICEMFAEELAESINESKYVELPPLRFTKETAKASNINMEAVIIDVDEEGLEEYESMKRALEGVDDLKTEADIDEVSEWNDEVPNIMEYEALTCEEVFEYDQEGVTNANITTESDTLQGLTENNVKKQKVFSPAPESSKEKSMSESQDATPKNKSKAKKGGSKPATHAIEAVKAEAILEQNLVSKENFIVEEDIYEKIGFNREYETQITRANDSDKLNPPVEYSVVKKDKPESAKADTDDSKQAKQQVSQDKSLVSAESEIDLDEKERLSKDAKKVKTPKSKKKSETATEENKAVTGNTLAEDAAIVSEVSSLNKPEIEIIESNDIKPVKTLSVEEAKEIATKSILESILINSKKAIQELESAKVEIHEIQNESLSVDVGAMADEVDNIDGQIMKLQTKIKKEESVKSQSSQEQTDDILEQSSEILDRITSHQDVIAKTKPLDSSVQQTSTIKLESEIAETDHEVQETTANTLQQDKILSNVEKQDFKIKATSDFSPAGEVKETSTVEHESKSRNESAIQKESVDVKEVSAVAERKPIFGLTDVQDECASDTVERIKKVSRTESVHSGSIPDIETYKDEEKVKQKDIYVDSDSDSDGEFDPEKYRERRSSSYEATLAGMDPELLAELGISPSSSKEGTETPLDLTKLPSESAEDRLSRIEEKAMKMALEDDSIPSKSRSRSRSRSKSRPPNLDTVMEKSKEEVEEARFYVAPSLDTIKESPSTASMAGMLQTGFSSTSINTVLQGSQSTSSMQKELSSKSKEESQLAVSKDSFNEKALENEKLETEVQKETAIKSPKVSLKHDKTKKIEEIIEEKEPIYESVIQETISNNITNSQQDVMELQSENKIDSSLSDSVETIIENVNKSEIQDYTVNKTELEIDKPVEKKSSTENSSINQASKLKDTAIVDEAETIDRDQDNSEFVEINNAKNKEMNIKSTITDNKTLEQFKSENTSSIITKTEFAKESTLSPTKEIKTLSATPQKRPEYAKESTLSPSKEINSSTATPQTRSVSRAKESSVDDILPPLEKVESFHEVDVDNTDEWIREKTLEPEVKLPVVEEKKETFNFVPGYKQKDEDLPEAEEAPIQFYGSRRTSRLNTPAEQRTGPTATSQQDADKKLKEANEQEELRKNLEEKKKLEATKKEQEELEKLKKEQAERAERERKIREEQAKAEREKEEADRKLKEEKEREESERKQKEERELLEAKRKSELEKRQKEQQEKAEAERKKLEADKKEKEEAERKQKAEMERQEAERKQREEKENLEEYKRLKEEREQAEAQKKLQEEAANKLQEETEKAMAEKKLQDEKEKAEMEKKEKAEAERRLKEKAELERKQKEELEKFEAEKKQKEIEQAELETKANTEKERKEQLEKQQKEKMEADKKQKEKKPAVSPKPTHDKTTKDEKAQTKAEQEPESKPKADAALPPKGKPSGRKTPQNPVFNDRGAKTPTADKFSQGYQETGRHSQGRGSSTEMSRYSTEHCYSPTYDNSVRSISGESHCRSTVERSLQTSQNLMTMVTGSLVPKSEAHKTKQPTQKDVKRQQPTAEQMARELENQKATPSAVSDIMIKEVGCNWVSLCWKKPTVTRGSPIHTYKVEAWLCGEGAFWVEIGRTPIPQYDVFNLKPNKCYHFRVTARNKRGWGDSIMTTHKVDLSKPTQMPVINTDMDSVIKSLTGSTVKLNVRISGEPQPTIKWNRDNHELEGLEGVTITNTDSGSCIQISGVDRRYNGKYTVTASNTAGKATKSISLEILDDPHIHATYSKFKSWQAMLRTSLPPYMVAPPRDRRVEEGGSIQLSCKVVGNPWPHVKWYKDDDEVIPDDYTRIYSEGDFQHVQIDDITLEHKGRYCVEAYNEHGVVRSHFTVIVDNGLERYMPPFFTKELSDITVRKGCNLLLHCRVESYPCIGVTWHQSGSKLRLRESDYKIVDEDGNVLLVMADMQTSESFNCGIINEIAENSTSCHVEVTTTSNQMLAVDEDCLRHSLMPRFTSWPSNQVVNEGDTVSIGCTAESCSNIILSRNFIPHSLDPDVVELNKNGNNFSIDIDNIRPDQEGLYFLSARNAHSEEKYPLIIRVKSLVDLSSIESCAPENKTGAPSLYDGGPVYARDGDTVIIKSTLESGAPPYNIAWKFNGQDIWWSSRVSPINVPGCIGIRMTGVGTQDEGLYTCTVHNSEGSADSTTILLVDYNEHKESEVMAELTNCPMLDNITPLMSWSNTPAVTPRRLTPTQPTPRGTPLLSRRASPRVTPRSTPRANNTPRATPTPLTPTFQRKNYDLRSPSVSSSHLSVLDDLMMPPPRRKYIQAPEIFSSFTSQTVEEGGAVEFKCFVSCAPNTTTTWERDGVPLISGANISLLEKTGVRMLKLHSVKMGDGGTYRMTITNKSGVTNCSAALIVKKRIATRSTEVTSSTRSTYGSSQYGSTHYGSAHYSSTHGYTPSRLYSNQYNYNSIRYL